MFWAGLKIFLLLLLDCLIDLILMGNKGWRETNARLKAFVLLSANLEKWVLVDLIFEI